MTVAASATAFASAGGSGTISVNTDRDCTWSATAGASWISLANSSGQGTANFQFTVAANGTPSARTGAIDVNGQSVSVSQQGAPCQFVLSTTSLSVPSAGGTTAVSVQAAAGCAWSAATGTSWISIAGGANGTGNGTVQVAIASNAGPARSGTLTIAGQTVTVTQADGSAPAPPPPPPPPPSCSYAISPAGQSFPASGGSGSIAVTSASGCSWSATSAASWVTIKGNGSGSGSGSVSFTVASNLGMARATTIAVADQVFMISQDAAPPPDPGPCTYSVSPSNVRVAATGGSGSVALTTGPSCSWTAVSNDSWISITSAASGSGPATIDFLVDANTAGNRNGTLTVGGQTVTVRQSGADAHVAGAVAQLTGSCPTLQFEVISVRVATDSSTTFMKGPCKNVQDGVNVDVQGTLQTDQSVLAAQVTLSR